MALLTTADITALTPGVDQAQSAAIAALQERVQDWCESPQGAGRPLELAEHRQIIRVNFTETQFTQLHRVPVVATPAPVIELRTGGPGQWTAMNESAYSVDLITGEVELWLTTNNSFQFSFDGWGANSLSPATTEIRATYTSGWDFSLNFDDAAIDPMAKRIKAQAALLLQLLWTAEGGTEQYTATGLTASSGATNTGSGALRSVQVNDEYRLDYYDSATTTTGGSNTTRVSASGMAADDELVTAIHNILYPLRKLQPRQSTAFGGF